MRTTLIVASGGGGDAITAAALTGPLRLSKPPVVMTCSWDRLMIDPLPGPRAAADFIGLRELTAGVLEVLPSTRTRFPANSSLPRLAADLPVRLLLLDPAGGVSGMTAQITAAARFFGSVGVGLIDVGGDVLTDGTDSGLRSPLADQLSLAACVATGLPARLLIAAPGLDGELPAETVLRRLHALRAERLPDLSVDDLATLRQVFSWHPSEASGLLAAAASGHRGFVEVRDAGDQIELTAETPALYSVSASAAAKTTPATYLHSTTSLDQAEKIIRAETGISEIQYETKKAKIQADRHVHTPDHHDLPTVDRLADAAASRGAHYISNRRLSELLGATTLAAYAALSRLLADARPDHYAPSIYRIGRPGSFW